MCTVGKPVYIRDIKESYENTPKDIRIYTSLFLLKKGVTVPEANHMILFSLSHTFYFSIHVL